MVRKSFDILEQYYLFTFHHPVPLLPDARLKALSTTSSRPNFVIDEIKLETYNNE